MEVFFFCCVFTTAHAQENSLEPLVASAQTGLLGAWVNAEWRLSATVGLRAEAGLDAALFGGDLYDESGYLLAPGFALEPRYHYNLRKRAEDGKNTLGNSANTIGIKTTYHPDWFVISDDSRRRLMEQLTIIPKWTMRRHIKDTHIHYELGAGIGTRIYFAKQYGYPSNKTEGAVDIHLRIGYTF